MSLDAGPVWRFSSLAVAVLLGALVAASPALSQSGRPPYDQAEIQRKIQKSVGLQRQALQALSDPKRAEGLLRSAWTELRAAQHEMIINASVAKFADPLFEITNRKAQEALVHLQAAARRAAEQSADHRYPAGSGRKRSAPGVVPGRGTATHRAGGAPDERARLLTAVEHGERQERASPNASA